MLKDKILKSVEADIEKQASELPAAPKNGQLKQAAVNALIEEQGYSFDNAVQLVGDFIAEVEKRASQSLGKSVDDTANTLFGGAVGGYAGGFVGRAAGAMRAAKATGNAVAISKGLNRGGKIGKWVGGIAGAVSATHARENNK